METLIQKEHYARPSGAVFEIRQSGWKQEFISTDAAGNAMLLVRRNGNDASSGYDAYGDKRGRESLYRVRPKDAEAVDPPFRICKAADLSSLAAVIQFKSSRTRREYRLQNSLSGAVLFFASQERGARVNSMGNLSWDGMLQFGPVDSPPLGSLVYSLSASHAPKTGLSIGTLIARLSLAQASSERTPELLLLLTAVHFVIFRETVLGTAEYDELTRCARSARESSPKLP